MIGKYWQLCSCQETQSIQSIELAKEFFQVWFPTFTDNSSLSKQEEKEIQRRLLSLFSVDLKGKYQTICFVSFTDQNLQILGWLIFELNYRILWATLAGLCLRCYVSHCISDACKSLIQKYSPQYGIKYCEISTIVLDDSGVKQLFFQDSDNCKIFHQSQFIPNFRIEYSSWIPYSVKIIKDYNPNKKSLKNWVYCLVNRYYPLQQYFSKVHDVQLKTDWAILNRISSNRKSFSPEEKAIVHAYHNVYRQDRHENKSRGKCKVPSERQLSEMQKILQTHEIFLDSTQQLLTKLKDIAKSLRGTKPITSVKLEDYSHHETEPDADLKECLRPLLTELLDCAIAAEIPKRITRLKMSRYSHWASSFLYAYWLLYFKGMSLGKVAREMGMTGQSQASRILNPTDLLEVIKYQVIVQVTPLLRKRFSQGDEQSLSNDPDVLMKAIERVEKILNEEVFSRAFRELKAGKNRQMTSLYAERIITYIENYI